LEATQCFEESLELCTRLDDMVGAGWCRIWLSSQAFWNDDLGRSEQLASQVLQDCSVAGAQHPRGQALCRLAFIARRRGDHNIALGYLRDAATVCRDLDDPWQLDAVLVELAAMEATMGQATEALQVLAESTRIDDQIGRLPGRSHRLAIAALVHLARGQTPLSIAAMGAYEAHPSETTEWGRPGIAAGYVGWLAETLEATKAQLDPSEVAAARTAASRKSLDELIDELIIQPATAAAGSPVR
jgi:hypothetical protein